MTIITEELYTRAEEIKDEANLCFKEKRFKLAIERYTEAIEINSKVPSYYTNRAFCHLKLEAYGYAISDSNSALLIDANFAKANYRRASANMALGNFKEALKDLRIVCKRAPNDKDAKAKYEECAKIIKRMDFEKAIEHHDQKHSVTDHLDLDAITVEASYDGPRINEKTKMIDIDFVRAMIDRFKNQKNIHKKYAFMIILAIHKYMLEAPTLVDVDIPLDSRLTVCGDIHGQFYDFINIFTINGYPSEKHIYLFNGDFVDRGSFSIEVILTLFAYKWLYPNQLFLTRGNHETDSMNKVYGFEGEVKAKFSEMMFKLFSETFNALPLAHVIQNKVFVTHGGLFSRDNVTLDEIRNIDRFSQPGAEGLMCELLWSDPQPGLGRSPSKRGVGIQFGPDVTKNFLETNKLDMMIRSHEVKEDGYVVEHDGKCITVFSAPNYCDTVGNKGALINFTPNLKKDFITFSAVPHPSVKPMQYASQFSGLF